MDNEKNLSTAKDAQSAVINSPQSSKPRLTPFSELLKNSFNIWRAHFSGFIKIYLWGAYYSLIPLAIIFIGTIMSGLLKSQFSVFLQAIFIFLFFLSFLFIFFFLLQAYAGMFVFVKKNYEGTAQEAFKEARPWAMPYLGLSLLTVILILLWSLLLIIPGIIFSIFYSFAVYALFFEDKKGLAAIKRSKSLVKNYWWPVAGRVFGFSLLLWIFMSLLGAPGEMVAENTSFWHFWNMVMQVIAFVISPLSLLFSYQIYRDLVNIKK